MSTYTDELEAERAVNKTLLRELTRRPPMAELFKLATGDIIKVEPGNYEVLSKNEVKDLAEQKHGEAAALEALIQEEPVAAAEPAVETPVQEPEAAAPEQAEPAEAPAPEAEQPAPLEDQAPAEAQVIEDVKPAAEPTPEVNLQ